MRTTRLGSADNDRKAHSHLRLLLLCGVLPLALGGTPAETRAQLSVRPFVLIQPPQIPMMECMSRPIPQGPLWDTVFGAMASEDRKSWRPSVRALEDSMAVQAASAPLDLESQFLYAVALGARTDVEGGRTQIKKASELQAQLELILEMDPGHPGANHLMGRLNAAVMRLGRFKRFIATKLLGGGTLSSASWEKARLLLGAGERGEPCVPDHHYELARLHVETGFPREARRELKHVMFLLAGNPRRSDLAGKATNLLAELEVQLAEEDSDGAR